MRSKVETASSAPDTCGQVLLAQVPGSHTPAGAAPPARHCATPDPTTKRCSFPNSSGRCDSERSLQTELHFEPPHIRSLTTSCCNGQNSEALQKIQQENCKNLIKIKRGLCAQYAAEKMTGSGAGFQESKRFIK